jgi:subtilisin-like proprotein convertase family protein
MRKVQASLALTALTISTMVVVAVSTGTAEAAGVPCQRTYSSGPVNASISYSNGSGIMTSAINVPEDGLVLADVDVLVNIHHTRDMELSLTLTSETDGATVRGGTTLFNHRGGYGENLLGTVFDDSSATAISEGYAPFAGRFAPEAPLAAVAGVAGGTWVLQVADSAMSNDGTLDDWSLTFRYVSCDFDHDGVEDHRDSCLQIAAATASGCPLASRSVTASYRLGKFKGYLSSNRAPCKAYRPVTIWKVRSGPDLRIGTASTRSDGFYKLVRARHRGYYYATSPRVVVKDIAECRAVKSATFRIR